MVYTIHETDLFRPHEDPDDHFDLACQYALAKRGLHSLRGIMIDYPPTHDAHCDPDIAAVAQLNQIARMAVPVGVGAPDRAPDAESGAANMLVNALRECPGKLTIHIVGSCRDVASAIRREPELFEEKCAAIYLNAGSAVDNGLLEYNVALDPGSYAGIFAARCPVYWMPCFNATPDFRRGEPWGVGRNGTFYRFTMSRVLDNISPALQNYFISMLERETDSRWKRMLERPVDMDALKKHGADTRNMWCTAGFLHAVGLSVDMDGRIVELGRSPSEEVFEFLPVDVECDLSGHTRWKESGSNTRYIFTVRDEARYQEAMTRALSEMLSAL